MNESFLSRRAVILGGASALLLAGCGFQLRRAPDFAFKSLSVPGRSAFVNALRRQFRAAGNVELIPEEEKDRADAILEVLSETRGTAVLSTNSAGQVRELQLRLTMRIRLRTPGGKELLGPTQIEQYRDITYNETAALAKEGETELLYRDMQSDIAQQTLRRLAAVKSL
ncbi:LPS assembly lipoprotein LptE [Variovorax sp. KK3]|uniref:LPS-assembly lipoprotein LptE n=1 Tax=Variovorax sp. KK3 TaxID=1855728 RepID=UPI00097BDA88|nr:LPS assembly lipoprotein LptE [Variovorax sp. KK3]